MKRVFALILVMLMVLSLATACAVQPYASNYFSSYGATLSKKGDGDVKITFSCGATKQASQLGVSSYTVQKSTSSGWTDVSGPHNGSSGSNVSSYSFSRNFDGVAGEKYRVSVTFFCTIGSSTEHKTYTSGSVVAN